MDYFSPFCRSPIISVLQNSMDFRNPFFHFRTLNLHKKQRLFFAVFAKSFLFCRIGGKSARRQF